MPLTPDGRRSRWTVDQALRWHTFLACHLTKQGTADLAWWELWQATPRRLRCLTFSLAAGFGVWLGHTLFYAASPDETLLAAAGESLAFGTIAGLAAGWAVRTRIGKPRRIQVEECGYSEARWDRSS